MFTNSLSNFVLGETWIILKFPSLRSLPEWINSIRNQFNEILNVLFTPTRTNATKLVLRNWCQIFIKMGHSRPLLSIFVFPTVNSKQIWWWFYAINYVFYFVNLYMHHLQLGQYEPSDPSTKELHTSAILKFTSQMIFIQLVPGNCGVGCILIGRLPSQTRLRENTVKGARNVTFGWRHVWLTSRLDDVTVPNRFDDGSN